MGLARLFGVCVAFLLASSVAEAVTIDLGPSDYRRFGPGGVHTPSGIGSSFGQTVRIPPVGTNLPVTRHPTIPYGSVANGMRNFVRINPASAAASAAITALFLGLDWVFDPELDSWAKPGPPSIVPPLPGTGFFTSSSSGTYSCNNNLYYGTKTAACQGLVDCSGQSSFTISSSGASCNLRPSGASIPISTKPTQCPAGSTYNPSYGCVIEGEFIPVTESDLDTLPAYLPSASPQDVADAAADIQRKIGNPLPGYQDTTISGPSSFSGPETTSTTVDPVTGDTTVTTTGTTTNINYGDTTITTTNTTVTNTFQNGQQTSSTTTTETSGDLPVAGGGGGAGDWPGFCDWATVVCDWLLWTQEDPPPEQELPSVIDDDFYEEKNISFGAKVCPPDYQISLEPFLSTPVGVSFQPLCDFAALIYYMVMAASYIIAAYISIGVARSA